MRPDNFRVGLLVVCILSALSGAGDKAALADSRGKWAPKADVKIDWAGNFKAFKGSGNYLKELQVKPDGDAYGLSAVLVLTGDEKSKRVAREIKLVGKGHVYHQVDGGQAFDMILANFVDAEFTPTLMLKSDIYTPEAKARAGRYFFHTCFLEGYDGHSYISGRLSREAEADKK